MGRALESIGLVCLLFASTPVVANALRNRWEVPGNSGAAGNNLDVVVVLAGGYIREIEPDQNELVSESYGRVACGVRTFRRSKAEWLVMSGTSGKSGESGDVDLMKTLAVDLGVDPGRVLVEPFSRNTFEHPRELAKMRQVAGAQHVGLVTSSWHLRRAMLEFSHLFPNVVPISCRPKASSAFSMLDLLPHDNTLSVTTLITQEAAGTIFYAVKHLLDR